MNSYCSTAQYSVETISRNFKMPSMHYHDAYELYYLKAGTREYFVEDKLFSVSTGEFVLIPPGKLHRTGGEYCVRTLVHFTDAFLEKIFQRNAINDLIKCFAHIKIIPNHEQQVQTSFLLNKLAVSDSETDFAIHLALLLHELSLCANEEIQHDHVSKIVAYINKNYATIVNISQLAEKFFVSKYHLCRIFKSAMHVTIIDYLNQIKLKNARKLLVYSDCEIGEVARLCGYRSMSYFSNIFKQNTGYAPSEFRKLQVQTDDANISKIIE